MKKSWISFICILLCVFIPFAAVASAIIFLPSQFENTFLGALEIKVNRIESIKEPKIVIVGGSSVPFGVDSKQMEEMLGMPVVNFGLYATLGTKLMLDLSREYINEGDIIVIAPETDAQTYSLFFNAEAAWQAADSDYSLLPKIAKDNFAAMLGGAWKFAAQKVKYYRTETKLDPQGIYNVKSFDEYGDITYPREYNKMELLFDSSLEIKLSKDIVSAEFIDCVNEYVEYAEGKGARVMFSFAPMNMDALSPDMTLEQIEEFKGFIKGSFKAELISDPNAYIYESGYFYDSNFHLNDAGAVYHTANLARDIAVALGKEIIKDFEIPDIPEIPGTDIPEPDIPDGPPKTDENEKYFVFEEFKVGGEFKGYNIIGLSELGVEQEILTTPTVYNGEKVYKLKANTFSGSEVTEIYVTDNI
ncbi:MAG: hypothetical protein IJX27_07540, partial [Clostridia bacterium]|nr:hypothetical protein [Clostridia bacterium]